VASVAEPVSGAATGRSGPPTGGLSAADPATNEEFSTYVTSAASRASFGGALRVLASSDAPMLWHCNSGTYRTGWATAVLLTALGVPRAQVYADFLLSNQAFGATYAFADYLDTAFGTATSTFGSFAGYLERGLGVGTDVQDQLKHALLSS
jgi:protein-tyrosine phosphatase